MTASVGPAAVGVLLVVEDQPEVAEMVAEVLRSRGYSVETASDGARALQAVDYGGIGMILSDVSMPIMDGVTLYRALEGRGSPLARRFAFMSAFAPRPELNEIIARTGAPLLRKPFLIRELLAIVDRMLASD
jgi:two-component system, cell cycle sensor histidine kinase and response regulator CckA